MLFYAFGKKLELLQFPRLLSIRGNNVLMRARQESFFDGLFGNILLVPDWVFEIIKNISYACVSCVSLMTENGVGWNR